MHFVWCECAAPCVMNISKVTCREIFAGFLLVHPLCVLRHSAALTMLLSKDFTSSPHSVVGLG